MTPVRLHSRRHDSALLEAYELIEAAQDRDVSPRIAALADRSVHEGWVDVRVLLHLAGSLAARLIGQDDEDRAQVQAMLACAEELGDPALLAFALATSAQRDADVSGEAGTVLGTATTTATTTAAEPATASEPAGSGAEPLVRAVVLLDGAEGPLVHQVAARLEVAGAFHLLGLWPLATEQIERARTLLGSEPADGPWHEVVARQWRVLQVNSLDMVVDEACSMAEVGDWEAARRTAEERLPQGLDVLAAIDQDWPRTWAATVHAFTDVLAALAGRPSPADRAVVAAYAVDPEADCNLVMLEVAEAIRAHHLRDEERAARLARVCLSAVGTHMPTNARLLAMRLAMDTPQVSVVALTYVDELVRLRWNSRRSRLASIQAAVNAERRRAEHEVLRGQVLVDDLTGLGNRRAYMAYLERAGDLALPATVELVIMMIDVDHFKAVNDTYGHDVGDAVLCRIGAILAAHVRPGDLAARLGGDEFVVVITQDQAEVGQTRAAAIVAAVRSHPWRELAPGLNVSVSLGLQAGPVADAVRLPAQADRQLYVAKRNGRGRAAG